MESMDTLSEKIKELKSKGFKEDFYFEDGLLKSEDDEFKPEDIKEIKEYRYEGKSNPDDMSILYQITTKDGTKGTIADGYGPTGHAELSQFLLKAES